jgi:nucleoid-associated protein YgaU
VVEVFGKGCSQWSISKKMYPNGVKVNVTGKAKHEIVDNTVLISCVDGPTTIKITKA